MTMSKFERFLPFTGVLAGVLFAVGGYLPKTSDDFGDPDAVAIMNDNATRNLIGAAAMALCCVALLFFAAGLRRALRSGEGGESTYSGVAYAGAILVAASQAAQAWLMFAGIDAADHHDKTAVSTLSYLGIDSWLPWVAASAAMLLATGLGGLHNAVLPRWLAIVTVILGIACLLGPTGVAVWFATPVWLVVVGVVLAQRQAADRPAVYTPATA
jgi:hypothetical protein